MSTMIDWTSAESVKRLAYEQEFKLGPYSRELADTLSKLGDLYFVSEDFSNAEDCYWRALSIRQRTLGEAHADVANNLVNLAQLYEIQDRYAEAERFYQWATEVKKQSMLKARQDRMEVTQTMSRAMTPEMEAILAARRIPQMQAIKDTRCRVCKRQLLDSPVCMYCTQTGFDAMAVLRAAGVVPGGTASSARGSVNALSTHDGMQWYSMRDPVVRIGRHPSNHIVFADDKNISRYHAYLTYRSGDYFIADNNTGNGTYVNGERISGEVKLQRGDVICLGNTILIAEYSSEGY